MRVSVWCTTSQPTRQPCSSAPRGPPALPRTRPKHDPASSGVHRAESYASDCRIMCPSMSLPDLHAPKPIAPCRVCGHTTRPHTAGVGDTLADCKAVYSSYSSYRALRLYARITFLLTVHICSLYLRNTGGLFTQYGVPVERRSHHAIPADVLRRRAAVGADVSSAEGEAHGEV